MSRNVVHRGVRGHTTQAAPSYLCVVAAGSDRSVRHIIVSLSTRTVGLESDLSLHGLLPAPAAAIESDFISYGMLPALAAASADSSPRCRLGPYAFIWIGLNGRCRSRPQRVASKDRRHSKADCHGLPSYKLPAAGRWPQRSLQLLSLSPARVYSFTAKGWASL